MSGPIATKAEGIVLKRKNVGEADRIVTLFTREYGKVRAVAKGIRKVSSRRAPHLEVFTRVGVVLHRGKTLESIGEVTPIESYEAIRLDLAKVSMAYYLCELTDSLLAERQEQSDAYDLLVGVFGDLCIAEGSDVYRRSREFALALLETLGFLSPGKTFAPEELQAYIETITERKLKSPHFAKALLAK